MRTWDSDAEVEATTGVRMCNETGVMKGGGAEREHQAVRKICKKEKEGGCVE